MSNSWPISGRIGVMIMIWLLAEKTSSQRAKRMMPVEALGGFKAAEFSRALVSSFLQSGSSILRGEPRAFREGGRGLRASEVVHDRQRVQHPDPARPCFHFHGCVLNVVSEIDVMVLSPPAGTPP